MFDELKAQFEKIEIQLDALSIRMRSFRTANTILVGQQICFCGDSLESGQRLISQWGELVSRRDSLIVRRNALLKKMAVLGGMKLRETI